MKIRAARSDDLDVIKALLAENELPGTDVRAALLSDFLVAEDASGAVVGSVGLEPFGQSALLRSLCVARHVRNAGLGTTLLSCAEAKARSAGARALAVDIIERRLLPADEVCGSRLTQWTDRRLAK